MNLKLKEIIVISKKRGLEKIWMKEFQISPTAFQETHLD